MDIRTFTASDAEWKQKNLYKAIRIQAMKKQSKHGTGGHQGQAKWRHGMVNEKRFIDANAVIAKYRQRYFSGESVTVQDLVYSVEYAPTVDAVEVVHGRWIIAHMKNSEYKYCFCSECQTLGSPRWKCCPVCTARMDGDGNG